MYNTVKMRRHQKIPDKFVTSQLAVLTLGVVVRHIISITVLVRCEQDHVTPQYIATPAGTRQENHGNGEEEKDVQIGKLV